MIESESATQFEYSAQESPKSCYSLKSCLIQSKTAARQSTPMKDLAGIGPLRPIRLIAGCDGPPFPEARPQTLDAVAIVVDPARAGDGRLVALGRDRRPCALVPDELAERVRGIALVADDPAGHVGQAIDQIRGRGKFMSLIARPAPSVITHALVP